MHWRHGALAAFTQKKVFYERMRVARHFMGRAGDDHFLVCQHSHPGAQRKQGIEVVRDHHDGQAQRCMQLAQQ